MTDYAMTIGGRRVASPTQIDVIDPATGEVFAQAPDCSSEQLEDAMLAAHEARQWGTNDDFRIAALQSASRAVTEAREALATVLAQEQGKPYRAALFEVDESARWIAAAADLEVPFEVVQDDERGRATVERRPLGVVAAITPWNFPLLLAAWKVGPALRAGNTMVLKPSPFTPLSTLLLGQVLDSALPPGVMNVVSGADPLGSWMTQHELVRKITFTGSVATGKAVAAAAAPDLKRYTLELGGNDAAIVLDDVDVESVGKQLFWSAFINNGQVCAGIKRVYVPESIHDELVEVLAGCAERARVGAWNEPGAQLGPLNNKPQLNRVRGLVDDAVQRGAKAVAGGAPLDRAGYFFAPTVIAGANDGMAIVDEEQFGPALPVMTYRNVDDAVDRANGTHFGLSGSVWGTDSDRAAEVASRLDSGVVFVNDHLTLEPYLPFGGVKWSGVGTENGHWGLEEFCTIRLLYRSRKQ